MKFVDLFDLEKYGHVKNLANSIFCNRYYLNGQLMKLVPVAEEPSILPDAENDYWLGTTPTHDAPKPLHIGTGSLTIQGDPDIRSYISTDDIDPNTEGTF